MPVRHALLAAFAVLVLGMGVYLFLEVRKPAQAQTSVASNDKDKDPDPPESADRDDASHADEAAIRSGNRLAGRIGLRTGAKPPPTPATPSSAEPPPPPPSEPGKLEGPKLDAVMAEANKAYDKMDFDEARAIAQKVLKVQPTNTRMLRIMTSSHCIEADSAEAQKYYNLLPGPDREQMKTRCARYGITFTEPPAK